MIKLVTVSRISKEKGFGRMLKMEQMLTDMNIKFVWDCYGDTRTPYAKQIIERFKHVKFKGITETPGDIITQYDYLVQLSDTEGFAYSMYEAISKKTPVIATNFPAVHETIIDGENGYILDMELSNLTPGKINNPPVIKSFTEKSTEINWINFITMANNRKKADQATKKKTEGNVLVEVTRNYFDLDLQVKKRVGEKFMVSDERAKKLLSEGVARILTNGSEKKQEVQEAETGAGTEEGETNS